MYGKYFEYDGTDSQELHLAIAGLEQSDDVTFGLGREVLHSSLNRYRNRVGHMGTRWSDVLTFNIQLIKDPCEFPAQSAMFFTEDEVDEINAWLTSPDYPKLLHMYDYDFERDSSGNTILIRMTEDLPITIMANGYYPITYSISGNTAVGVIDDTPQYDTDGNLINSKRPTILTMIYKYDGYYSLQIDDDDFIKSVYRLIVDDIEYTKIQSKTWLIGDVSVSNSYTTLVRTEKVLNSKYDYFGVFSDVQPQIIDGDVVGFTATFQTNSPFAWTHEIKQTISDGSVAFTVNNAERYREIYPIIEITSTADRSLMRTNFTLTLTHQSGEDTTESESMTLSLRAQDTTTIDSRLSIIKDYSGLVSFTDLGVDDVDYIYWPKLYNGENTVTLTGEGTAIIKYREPRKVGDY